MSNIQSSKTYYGGRRACTSILRAISWPWWWTNSCTTGSRVLLLWLLEGTTLSQSAQTAYLSRNNVISGHNVSLLHCSDWSDWFRTALSIRTSTKHTFWQVTEMKKLVFLDRQFTLYHFSLQYTMVIWLCVAKLCVQIYAPFCFKSMIYVTLI